MAVQAYSKLASSGSYGAAVSVTGGTTTTSGTNKIYAKNKFLISGFSDAVYDIKITATDGLSNVATITTKIPSQKWAIHFRNKGDGAAFGKTAEYNNVLDVGTWDIYLRDSGGNIVSLKTRLGI